MSRASRVLTVSCAVSAVLLGTGTAPSLAAADPAAAVGDARSAARADGPMGHVSATSTFFAGYVAPLGTTKKVVGKFTVPDLDCGDNDRGIDTLIELASGDGAFYVDGAVFSSCVGGVADHYAAFDTATAAGYAQVAVDGTVKDGDTMKVVSEVVGGVIKVRIENLTRDWAATDSFGGVTPTHAAVLKHRIAVDGVLLDAISKESVVTGVKVSKANLKAADPTKFKLLGDGGAVKIKPTKIKGGTDFTFKKPG